MLTQPLRARTASHSGVSYISAIAVLVWLQAFPLTDPVRAKKPRQLTKVVSMPCSFMVMASGTHQPARSDVTPMILTSPASDRSTASEKPVDRAQFPLTAMLPSRCHLRHMEYSLRECIAPAASMTIAATRWSIPPGTEPPPMGVPAGRIICSQQVVHDC